MSYIIPALLFVLIFSTIFYYNSLVKKKNRMKEAWSAIDVYLKKRHDLIPNLIAAVKGYATHEQQVMEELTRLRISATQPLSTSEKVSTENKISEGLSRLMFVAENYPDLKASANFQQFQIQLETLETEIEQSRRYYNGTVRENNILVQSFPGNIIAPIFKFKEGIYFEISNSEEREVPKVAF